MKNKDNLEGKNKLKKRILKMIEKKGSVNLKELIGLGASRNSVTYHIQRLCADKKIRAFVKGSGLKDEEIYYALSPGKYPHEIHEIKKTIDDMCKDDNKDDTSIAVEAYQNFMNRCMEQDIPKEEAKKLAYALISGLHSKLKEKVVFELTYNNDWRGVGNYNPEKKQWEGGMRDYKYFINL